MIVGTTPTFTLTVLNNDELDFNEVQNIYFTIRQSNIKVTKTTSDITILAKNKVQITFTQAETIQFKYNTPVEIQLNWTYQDGVRAATFIKTIDMFKNLIGEVIQ